MSTRSSAPARSTDPARSRWAVPAACAAASLAVVGLAVAAELRPNGWQASALVRADPNQRIGSYAQESDPSFRIVPAAYYDGVYFYAMARDPLARGHAHTLFDEPSYRYGHPLYSWLSWLASAGRPRAVPWGLLAVSLLSLLVAAGALSALSRDLGWTAWGGLAVALNPGLVYATMVDTAEPVGVALLALTLLAYVRRRMIATVVCLALLCLAKEPFVVVALALAAWEVLRRRRIAGGVVLGAAVVPAVAWWAYIRVHLGHWPIAGGHERLGVPLAGWRRALLDAGVHITDRSNLVVGLAEAELVLLVVLAGALLLGGVLALRLRSPVDAAYLALAAVVACASAAVIVYPTDVLRGVSFLVLLLPLTVAARAERSG